MEMRQCKKCKQTFPLNRTYFGGSGSGGLRWSCRSCMAAHTREWAAANPERLREREQLRRDRTAGITFTYEERLALLREQGSRCALCGLGIATIDDCDVDHLVPVSRWGDHSAINLVASHRQCNKEKHSKTLREYVEWRKLNRLPPSTFSSEKIRNALR
jgi:5-methylcytosine-specific restriction endonuclease McrA